MDASVTLTFLSAVSRVIQSGDRAGTLYYRAHFLNTDEEPSSFGVSSELFNRFKNECCFGDVIEATISIRSTPSGTYTQLVGFKTK